MNEERTFVLIREDVRLDFIRSKPSQTVEENAIVADQRRLYLDLW